MPEGAARDSVPSSHHTGWIVEKIGGVIAAWSCKVMQRSCRNATSSAVVIMVYVKPALYLSTFLYFSTWNSPIVRWIKTYCILFKVSILVCVQKHLLFASFRKAHLSQPPLSWDSLQASSSKQYFQHGWFVGGLVYKITHLRLNVSFWNFYSMLICAMAHADSLLVMICVRINNIQYKQ